MLLLEAISLHYFNLNNCLMMEFLGEKTTLPMILQRNSTNQRMILVYFAINMKYINTIFKSIILYLFVKIPMGKMTGD